MVAEFPYELEERFEPVRELSVSSRSTVYEALDKKLDRTFAVKVSDVGPDGLPGGLARLKHAVDAIVQLRSPHIVPIYDLVELIDDRVALVLEMVEGKTLSEVLDEGALDSAEAVVLLHQLANALADMHMRGLVHRNISPAGLMLQRLPNGETFLRVLDFGRVKLSDETPARIPVEDPRYAAPEEMNEGADIGPAADVFSAGAVAYHMLTGQAPWRGNTSESIESARQFPLPPVSEVSSELAYLEGLPELLQGMMILESSERIDDIQEVVDIARELMKTRKLALESSSAEQTNLDTPPLAIPHQFSQFGLDANSSSVACIDDLKRLHYGAKVSELDIDAEITEICATHEVIVGDDAGRVWGPLPDKEIIYSCPDGAPVTALDTIKDLKAIAVGTLEGHIYIGRRRRDARVWSEESSGEGVDALALTPDGSLLAVARKNQSLEIIDGPVTQRIDLPTKRVRSLSWSRDNSILLVLLEGILQVYDRRGVKVYEKPLDPALLRLEYDDANELTALWAGENGVETRPFSIDFG